MTPNDLLQTLLARLGRAGEAGLFLDANDITEWPQGGLDALTGAGLLQPAEPAASTVCDGCEEACPMPVNLLPAGNGRPARAFIVCDQRDDVGRVPVPLSRLERWRSGTDLLAAVVAGLLDTGETPTRLDGAWHLGRAVIGGSLRPCILYVSAARRIHAGSTGGASTLPGSGLIRFVPTQANGDASGTDDALVLSDLMWFSGTRLNLDVATIARAVGGDAPAASPYRFRRDGDFWDLCYDGAAFKAKDAKGLRYIARLLERPGEEVHVFDLHRAVNGAGNSAADPVLRGMSGEALEALSLSVSDLGDAGELMTPEGKRRLQQTISQINDQIADAEELGDLDQAARLEEEKTAILEHLAAATGLGGRSRRSDSAVEKVRKAVTQAIQRSIRSIERNAPALGAHLTNTITTGTTCSYRPEKPVSWSLD